MDIIGILFLVVNAVALLVLPRGWAPLPLLIGACYMTYGQLIELGPFNFTVLRVLVAVGFLRVLLRREWLAGRINALDKLMLVFAGWALVSSAFHNDPSATFIFMAGLVYNTWGIYFLLRIFCRSLDDVVRLCRIMAILLIPLAVEMLYEKMTEHNLFASLLGGLREIKIREGRIRAQGPFAHAILAGTAGAVNIPLMIGLWRKQRKIAIAGLCACIFIIIASASSGPIFSALAAIGALLMWNYRHRMRLVRWFAVFFYIVMDIVMMAPAYFLIARADIVGGSTGWHRAKLIESAFEHINEWWFAGTDYTRHWMVTGVFWSPEHADITNHYLEMGVLGGLPLMAIFIAILVKGFSFVGTTLRQVPELSSQSRYLLWALGASLFAHAVTFISVSYFDQSFVFLYLILAAISSVRSATAITPLGSMHS